MIKTPLNFWIRTIEIVFCLILGFVFDWVAGIVIFVYGEILLILAQKEMAARMEIAMESVVQPEINKLHKKLKDAEVKAKKIKFLRGRRYTDSGIVEIDVNMEEIASIEPAACWGKNVFLKTGQKYYFETSEEIEK